MKRRARKQPWRTFLDEQIEEYLHHEIQDNLERGMTADEARRAALRKFGNRTRVREQTRAVWVPILAGELLQDVAYALRIIGRNAGFSFALILTLALGIGMSSAMFSTAEAVFIDHFGYAGANRIIWIAAHGTRYEPETDVRMLPVDYAEMRDHVKSCENLIAYNNEDLALNYGSDAGTERVVFAAGDLWKLTGAKAALGRLFAAGQGNAIVLSWELFTRRFGGDRSVIGKSVELNGHEFEVTGVLPAGFKFQFPQFLYPEDEKKEVGAYVAITDQGLRLPVAAYKGSEADKVLEEFGPTPPFVWVVGKLRPGLSIKAADTELNSVYERLSRQSSYPSIYHADTALRVEPLHVKLTKSVRPAFVVLSGAVAFVFLIACGNVASLLLARATSRRREISMRMALGAGGQRILRQLLTESMVLGLAGGLAGLFFAKGLLDLFVRLGSSALPRLSEARLDGSVLLFALLLSLAAAVLFGFAPALSLANGKFDHPVKETAPTSSLPANRIPMRSAVIVLEISFATVLLSGAGLLLKSFYEMTSYPAGFTPNKIAVMNVSLAGARYETWPQERAYIQSFFERVRALPGVTAVGVHVSTFNTAVTMEGTISQTPLFAAIQYVSPEYLQVMGVPLLKGHWATGDEAIDDLIVNKSFAQRMTAGQGSLIGRHLHASLLGGTIVGVVPDFKVSQLDAETGPVIYAPYEMSPRVRFLTAATRMSGDPVPMMGALRKAVSGVDADVAMSNVGTLEEELGESIAPRRFYLWLLSSFAAAAAVLACIGTYGLVSFLTAQRTREIGIRVAIGAQRGNVIGMIMRQGFAIVAVGIFSGLLGALALSRAIKALLYNVQPTDPSTLLAVAVGLALAAMVAVGAPALGASRTDPMIALRQQ